MNRFNALVAALIVILFFITGVLFLEIDYLYGRMDLAEFRLEQLERFAGG